MSVEVVASSTILRTIKSEFFLWVIAACIISGRFLVSLSFYGLSPKALLEVVNFYYFDILIGVTIMVFPLLFLQIFGEIEKQTQRKKLYTFEEMAMSLIL